MSNLPYGIKRKLTRKEATKITKEIMDMGVSPETRFFLVIIKAIEITNQAKKKRR